MINSRLKIKYYRFLHFPIHKINDLEIKKQLSDQLKQSFPQPYQQVDQKITFKYKLLTLI